MAHISTRVSDLIGGTPLYEVTAVEKKYNLKARVLVKLEYLNLTGSIKDRVALKMIDDAEKNGKLYPGSVIIEPTSGNTGIGLAAVGRSRGYRVIIVMPETMSEERRTLMKAYGAELVLTDGSKGMKGAIEKAEELAKEIPSSFIPGQFTNPSNPEAHYETTGPEIWRDTDGKVDMLIAGIGTGGTISGTGRYLKEKNPKIDIIGIEPAGSPVLTEGRSGKHGIQGIGAGFVPDTLDRTICSSVVTATEENAYYWAREMGFTEGILIGISSGAALWKAVDEAVKEENEGKTIVAILPDGGDRYLSTPLYKEL
jgi:cysteine synthase